MKKVILALGATALLSGCAAISKGPKHHIMFTSTPTNVLTVFSDEFSCYTPCTRFLDRKTDIDVTFSHGNEIREVSMTSGIQKDFLKNSIGNYLFFGATGYVIDALSGKNIGFETNHVHVEF